MGLLPAPLPVPIVQFTEGVAGTVTAVSADGTFYRYDSTGTLTEQFTPQLAGAPTVMEAWQGVQTFLFYREYQQYRYLSRLAARAEPLALPGELGFISLATPSADNQLWLLDQSRFVLSKYNPELGQNTINVPLHRLLPPAQYKPLYMREYKKQLYLSVEGAGVLVFAFNGAYLRTLPLKAPEWFGMYRNHLYYLQQQELVLFGLGKGKEQRFQLPLPPDALLLASGVVWFSKGLQLYRLRLEDLVR